MSNMSHCRFQNTTGDLEDCFEHIYETSELSEDEKEARLRMIEICVEIAIDLGYEVGDEVDYVGGDDE